MSYILYVLVGGCVLLPLYMNSLLGGRSRVMMVIIFTRVECEGEKERRAMMMSESEYRYKLEQ